MITIEESKMVFGPYPEENVFRIEDSGLHASFGEGIKTVEFILLQGREKLLFVEAKTSCPNPFNKEESKEKAEKFEAYFAEIADKFIDSLQMLLNVALKRKENIEEIGKYIKELNYAGVKIRFILVIQNAENEEWLAGPKEELNARLQRWRQLWKAEIVVLNEKLAEKYKLIQK